MTFPAHPTIIVGGGLAGLAAAHQAYNRGSNVVLLDKQGFLSGNSGKATSGINGSLTRTQVQLGIKDSVDLFYDDTLATAKDRANPELIKVLTYHSAEAIHWLQEHFQLDLSVVSRLGGHSQPRTHRGRDSKFPGMAITYKLLETLEALAEADPSRVVILKHTQVIDLVTDEHRVLGVIFKNLKSKEKGQINGPVIMCTGGYAADFTKNSLLRKYRPDILDLPSTNGVHATGDGQKIMMKHKGVGIDMDKVQVHPTGLIDLDDKETIAGKKQPRFLFLGAEALRGEGGIMLNSKGERFVDELGTRDYVSGEMEKQVAAGNGPIRLVLSLESEKKLLFHIKHYKSRNLMKTITGTELAQEIGCSEDQLARVLDAYNKAASGESADEYGKKYFPNTPFVYKPGAQYHVSFVTRVLHFTMGGIKINDKTQVVYANGDKFVPLEGLYAAGEVAGGVHGHNRLGGSSLLACVVFGRLAADQACSYSMQKMSMARLKMVQVHLDGQPRVVVDYGDGQNSPQTESQPQPESSQPQNAESSQPQKTGSSGLVIPDKEFTPEEVAKHNTADDCWVIIKNVVLDLTLFLKDHPGGEHSITTYAGKDATESFDMLHDDSFIRKYTSECVLGRLKGEKIKLDTSK